MHLRHLTRAIALSLVASLLACDAVRSVGRERELTPHERYAEGLRDAGLVESALGREWLAAADTVFSGAHRVMLPFQESGFYDRAQARAVGFVFAARDGQKISVLLRAEGQRAQIFVDLFVATTDSLRPWESVASSVTDSTNQSVIRYETRDSVTLMLRVQPELLRGGRFHVTIQTDPMLSFPVEGKGNAAAQSFWGVDRDGGRRSHQGVDIFATRGTPVLAATDGQISSLRSNPLGGNVIWQRDDHRPQSIYYAHLDRHYVTEGSYARAGDTIGFVGNTGNARTTSPHLHFGIYRRNRGAIDPWPYVRRNVATLAPIRADSARVGSKIQLRAVKTVLWRGPQPKADTVATIGRADTVQVVGASANYFRVELTNGLAGYIPATTALTGPSR